MAHSSPNSSKKWRGRMRIDGFKRFVLWLEPELSERILEIADRDVVPKSVAVEKIIKGYFEVIDHADRT
jgi:hypothetical protein